MHLLNTIEQLNIQTVINIYLTGTKMYHLKWLTVNYKILYFCLWIVPIFREISAKIQVSNNP